ncbi:MAG: hypothetical protein KIT63_25030 [Rhodoferax sp.]|nr:hypothetical protein [Rhodoferax sp.]
MVPAPTTGTPPTWRFSPQWQVLPGMAYGSRQPVMLGLCEVVRGHWDHGPWERAMAGFFSEPTAAGGGASDGPDEELALVRRLLAWSLAVQRRAKVPVFEAPCLWRDGSTGAAQPIRFALPYAGVDAGKLAIEWVSRSAQQAMRGQPPSAAAVDDLMRALRPFQAPGFNTIRFLEAAHALDLPWRGVVPGVIAYGQGHACRWLESSYTDRTPVVGTRLARDKFRTAQVLRQLGFPAPVHARAVNPQMAVQLARQLGYPVVVKPADRDQGQGVSADLRDDAAVLAAFALAAGCSDHILVEKHAEGNDYRLTVLNGRLIKAIVRQAAGVVGDGRHTIAELVQHQRQDPAHLRAGELRGHAPIGLDTEALELLAQNGLTPQTVPASGRMVGLRRRANVSAGGTPALVQGFIHPDNRRLAERAAAALQLDLAGVDLIMADIGRSWLETGALICEVNGQPQLGSSTTPGIYRQVLRELLPGPWRIPVVLMLASGAEAARQLHARLAGRVPPWGLACAQGVWEDREQLAPAPGGGFAAARVLAGSRSIGGAIIVMTAAELLRDGLPFDRLCLLVVTAERTTPDQPPEPVPQAVWPMVLAHVDGAVACASSHMHTLPTTMLEQRALPLQCIDDGDTRLADQLWPLLAGRIVPSDRAAAPAAP